jgi:hypothetical protein
MTFARAQANWRLPHHRTGYYYTGRATLLDDEQPTVGGSETLKQVLTWDLYRR